MGYEVRCDQQSQSYDMLLKSICADNCISNHSSIEENSFLIITCHSGWPDVYSQGSRRWWEVGACVVACSCSGQ